MLGFAALAFGLPCALEAVDEVSRLEARIAAAERGSDANNAEEIHIHSPDRAKAERFVATQRDDGTWPEVDYGDKSLGGWRTAIGHLRTRALFLARSGGYEDAVKRALDWWARERPQSPNWWWNEIGAPQDFALAAIMIAPSLTDADRARYADYLKCSEIKRTGQNRVWLSRIVMMRGVIARDEKLVDKAVAAIAAELRVSAGNEGAADDWSFRQHGPQMQFGNYGLSYALNMSRLANILAKTKWRFADKRFAVLGNLLERGFRWTVWNDRMDAAALGRQIGPGASAQKAGGVALAIADCAKAGWRFPVEPPKGFRFFPRSAYAVYRTDGWMASVKMNTRGVLETESWVNGENTLGGHLADGAMYLYETGREYDDVFPLWRNWRLVPGITSYADLPPVKRRYNEGPGANELNEMEASEDADGARVDFAIRRDGLFARKGWRFTPSGVEATGRGITATNSASRVVTCVEHCLAKENARVLPYSGGSLRFVNGDFEYEIFAPVEAISVTIADVDGDWTGIHPQLEGRKSRGRVLLATIDHGVMPKDASYRYRVAFRKAKVQPDLFTGTSGTAHCTPAAMVPFGAVQAGPDTGILDWKYCSGYQYGDTNLIGFSSTHLSGTGCADLGDLRLLPFSKGVADAAMTRAMDKSTERATPGCYAVKLADDGVLCEMTASKRAGLFRFTWPKGAERRLLADLQFGIVVWGDDGLTNRVLSCETATTGDGFNAALLVTSWTKRRVFEAARFSVRPLGVETLPKANPCERAPRFVYDFGVSDGTPLLVATGFSTVDCEGAAKALCEVGDFDFERVRREAEAAWDETFSRMEVDGDERVVKLARTALYHFASQPRDIADEDGRYRGADDAIHHARGGVHYGELSLWDTYRAAHPLATVLFPERVEGYVETLLSQGEEQGYLPVWALRGRETDCMVGNPAIPVIADACLKGLAKPEPGRVLAAFAATLDRPRPASRSDLLEKYGYFPCDIVATESVSKLLEDAVSAGAAVRYARSVGADELAARWGRRAKEYANVYDARSGFFRGRDSAGRWPADFNPLRLCNAHTLGGDFTEANAWQYLWHVQHDVPGLVALMGGRERFLERLETLFALPSETPGMKGLEDVSGLIGQYAHGNEPSHHVAYLFALEGRAWRTQEIVREVVDTLYSSKPDGICGNEDCGQMSAWLLFSIAGFYPVDPASGEYVLGAPQARRVVMKVGGGRTFTVVAKGLSREAKYVKGVTLDGRPHTVATIRHADIARGGELVFEMTSEKTDKKE